MKKALYVVLACLLSLASCATLTETISQAVIEKGRKMWQECRYEEAIKAWGSIPDDALQARFLSAASSYMSLMKESALYVDVSLLEESEESWKRLIGFISDLIDIPQELRNDPYRLRISELRESLGGLAEKLYPAIVKQRGIGESYAFFERGYVSTGTPNSRLEAILAELKDGIAAKKKMDDQAARLYAEAAGILRQLDYSSTFMEKINTYDTAIARMTEARSLYLESRASYGADVSIEREAVRIKNAIADTVIAKEKLVRTASTSLSGILSEIFSRLPQDTDMESMGKDALLDFYQGKNMEIQEALSEMEKLAREYRNVIDGGKLRQFQKDAAGFTSRVNRILASIANAEQLRAQRGNMAFPLIIGLFNPTASDPKKSRPAAIAGTTAGGAADWWWGSAEVDDDNLYRLVIHMNDSRIIRAFPESFKNRSVNLQRNLITEHGERYNTWSIDDAGYKLNRNGEYYLQINAQPQGSQGYNAEIVLYEEPLIP